MDYVYPYKEKVGRPKSKPQEFIDSTEVVYETEEHMDSFEIDEEQVSQSRAVSGKNYNYILISAF
jgi:hypothetical protein